MKCRSVELSNFRNIECESVSFSDGINVLWGNNAQGKSNILEGIYYFARGRSFRGAKDREMIRFQSSFASLKMDCIRDRAEHPVTLEVTMTAEKGSRTVTRDKAKLSGMSELIGSFRAVLFCPAHLSLVGGAPQNRRSFLDIAISQLSPSYIADLSKYTRLLLQRNAALKAAEKGESIPFQLWETFAEQIVEPASRIASLRFDYMSMLSGEMETLFQEMTGGAEKPRLSYVSHAVGNASLKNGETDEIEAESRPTFGSTSLGGERIYELLTSDVEKEIRYGATLWGVHKDDIRIRLNGKEARSFASQGQMRSLALAMKLSEGELSRKIGGEKPVILLDDVLSELDLERREFVLNSMKDRQIIVTSCEPGLFDSVGEEVNLIGVKGGRVFGGGGAHVCFG